MNKAEIKKYVLESISLLSYAYITIAIFAISLVFALKFIFPEVAFIEMLYSKTNNLYSIVTLIFSMGAVGWLAKFHIKEIKFISPLTLSSKEILSLSVISIFFGRFLLSKFSLLPFNAISLVLMTTFLLTLITQILHQLEMINIKNYRDYIQTTLLLIMKFRRFVSILIIIIVVLISTLIINGKTKTINNYKNLVSQSLIITSIEPSKTTVAHNIALNGHNFGTIKTEYHRLMSTYGQAEAFSWTENKIEFTVPLEWKPGKVDLWIEKPISPDNNTTYQSNKISFQLLPRWDFYPVEGEGIIGRGYKKIVRLLFLK